jgi:ubiquinol-cytochrome C reductase complex subunit VI
VLKALALAYVTMKIEPSDASTTTTILIKGRTQSFISTRSHDSNMSQPSLAGYIVKRPWLKRWVMPLANWYANAAGYRKLGLRYEQLQRPGNSD